MQTSHEATDRGPAGGRARAWLVFPPLLTSNQHPEIGVPELAANLRAAGHDVLQRDLNIELVYDHLTRGDVLARLARWLVEADPGGAAVGATEGGEVDEPRRWHVRLERAAALLPTSADRGGRTVLAFLEHQRRRTNRPGRPDESWVRHQLPLVSPETWADWPPAVRREAEAFVRLCATRSRFWGTLVDALQYVFFAPRSWRAPDVLAAAGGALPALPEFYARVLAEREAEAGPPDVVGVSLHGADQLVPAFSFLRAVAARWPAALRVVGGPWCAAARSLLPDLGALFDIVDAVVVGEGNEPLLALAARHLAGAPLAGVPGVAVRDGGRVALTPPGPRRALASLALPEFAELPLRLYPEQRLPVRLHCGCGWGRCRFCYHVFPGIHDTGMGAVAGAHLDRVVAHVAELRRRFGVRYYALLDHAVPFATLDGFARRVLDAGLDIEWDTMARFEPGMTEDRCRVLHASGGRDLFLGLETIDAEGLRFLRKGITPALVEEGVAAAAAAGFRVRLFLLNYPGQTLAALQRTVDWAVAHVPAVDDVVLARFALARGTAGWENYAALRLHVDARDEPDLDVFDVAFRAEDEVSFEDYKALWVETQKRLSEARRRAGLEPQVRQPGQPLPRPRRAVVLPFAAATPPEHHDLAAGAVAAAARTDETVAAAFDVEVWHDMDLAVHGAGPIAWRLGDEAPDVLLLWLRPGNAAAHGALFEELQHKTRRPLLVAGGPLVAGARALSFLARAPVIDVALRDAPSDTFTALLARVAEGKGAPTALAGLPGAVVRVGRDLAPGPPRAPSLGSAAASPFRARTVRPREQLLLAVDDGFDGGGPPTSDAALADALAWARDHRLARVRVTDDPLSDDGAHRLAAAAAAADPARTLRWSLPLPTAPGAGHEALLRTVTVEETRVALDLRPLVARTLPAEVRSGARPVLGWRVAHVEEAPDLVALRFERRAAAAPAPGAPSPGVEILDVEVLPPGAAAGQALAGAVSLRFAQPERRGLGDAARDLARRLTAAFRRG